jgi:O-acetylserine/cysteine efflux transporter
MSYQDLLLALLSITIWGGNIIAVKAGIAELPPLLMTALRLLIAAAVLLPFTRLQRRSLPWIVLLSFTFSTCHFSLMFLGLQSSEAGTGAILLQMGTPLATLLGMLVFKEHLNRRQIVGLLISLSGVVLLTFSPSIPAPLPFTLLLGSALAWAISNLIVKYAPDINMMELLCWSSLFGVPQVGLASCLFEQHQLAALYQASWQAWVAVGYCALLSSALGYLIWYRLLRKYPVSKVAPLSLLSPVLSVIFGVFYFDDSLDPEKIAGAAITVGGIVVMSYVTRKKILPLPATATQKG